MRYEWDLMEEGESSDKIATAASKRIGPETWHFERDWGNIRCHEAGNCT